MENTFCETYPTVFSCSYNSPVKTRTDLIKVNSNDGICIYSDNILLAIILFALWMTFAIATFMQIFLIIRKSIYSICCIAKYYLTSKLMFFSSFPPSFIHSWSISNLWEKYFHCWFVCVFRLEGENVFNFTKCIKFWL